ncbi:MAG: DNA translocase FtsK [Candidatus Izemoplasmatales bacterium]|nr:DNA translocase FtsK [Candidatus Izemoplasmatales bacterium]
MKNKVKPRYQERIVPGVSRSADTRPFFIPQISRLEDKETQKQKFVSPIFGKAVKDDVIVPNDHRSSGDIDKKYDVFRKERKLTKEEAKRRYGDTYYEFFSVSNKDLSKIHERNLSADDLLKKKQDQEAHEIIEQARPKVEEVPIQDFFGAAKEHEETTHARLDDVLRDIGVNQEDEGELDKDRFSEIEEDDVLFPENEEIKPKAQPKEASFDDDFTYVESTEVKPKPISQPTLEKIRKQIVDDYHDYRLPPVSIFKKSKPKSEVEATWIQENIDIINQTLLSFDIDGTVTAYTKGPTVTRYEISLGAGVQVKKITSISDNMMMNLAALSLRIEAPIPGKTTVGVEVPNKVRESVFFGDVVDNPRFFHSDDPLIVAVGLDIDANPVYTTIEGMPHGLVAGSTQSGKSVCIASIIASLIYKNKPDQIKLLLIDPKKVDLQQFSDLPHLVTPIIDETKLAVEALKWAVNEMERRYDVLKKFKAVDVKDYYRRRIDDPQFEKMPRIVVIVEEASDLLISGGAEIEESILKLTQKSRAVGIHLLLATQRPSADILKGAIKANLPTRFAFKVPSSTDSSVVLDTTGAEKLLGKGDMLLSENGLIRRLQGAYLSPEEIEELTEFIKEQAFPQYIFTHEKLAETAKSQQAEQELDELFGDIARFVVDEGKCSLNKISQVFGIGFNRAAQVVGSLELHGIVSENAGTKPREVIVGYERLEQILDRVGRS